MLGAPPFSNVVSAAYLVALTEAGTCLVKV
jgi:hypothetical protein